MQNCNSSARTAAQQSSKCSLLFRPAALAAILLLAAVFLSSCDIADEANERAKVLNSGQMVNGYKISIIEFDSCQYLISGNGYSQMMTHKGNCKFCAARHSR